jgi:membrane associated rhomboid family serine protease
MLPLTDGKILRKKPLIVYGLIIVNVLIFMYEYSIPNTQLYELLHTFGLLRNNLSPFTLITFNFLHGGFLHILFNMVFLWAFGRTMEASLGHWKFLIFYLLGGVGAGLLQLALTPGNIPLVGASGAIAAVLGAYLVLFPTNQIKTLIILIVFITIVSLPAFIVITLWFVQQLLSGYLTLGAAYQSGGIAYWGHIGGFMAGVIMIFLLKISGWANSKLNE